MTAGYTRQRAADIVNGNIADASQLNDELNNLLAAMDVSSGHSHDGTTVGGGAKLKPVSLFGGSGDGIVVQNTTGTTFTAARTITGTANEITVTNGSAVSGNPTLSIPTAVTLTGKTLTNGIFTGGTWDNGVIGGTTAAAGTFTTLKTSGTTLTFQSAGTTGTLTWAPSSTGKTITLPNGTTDFTATGGTSQVLKQVTAGAAITVAQLAASDLSNGVQGSGAVVLATSPTITTPTISGHFVAEGVTTTGAVGTGNLVFSIAPTFTGTTTAAVINSTTHTPTVTRTSDLGSASLVWNNGLFKTLQLNDSDNSNFLKVVASSNLTSDRTLSLATGDADRTLTFTADATIGGTHSGTSSGTNTGDQTITLTSDVTGSGTGSFATTLATVNGNVGAFTNANITVNAKGLITAAASGSAGTSLTRVAKTSGYTVIAGDAGKVIDCTSGTFTLTLTAAATLGDGFIFYVINSGTGLVTIDANASETINGALTLTLNQYQSVMLICDGSNWKINSTELGAPQTVTTGVTSNATLTAASSRYQTAAMSSDGQSFTLPAATTLSNGVDVYTFYNSGDRIFGVRDGSATLLAAVHPGGFAQLSLSDDTTTAGVWALVGRGLSPGLTLLDHMDTSFDWTADTAGQDNGVSLALSATLSMHFVQNSSGNPYVYCVDASTFPATVGTKTNIVAASCQITGAWVVSSTKAFVSLTNGGVGKGYNISVSGTTCTVSTVVAAPDLADHTFTGQPKVAALSATSYLAARVTGATVSVSVIDASTTNPTVGSSVTGGTTVQGVTAVYTITSTTAAVFYVDDSGSAGTPFSLRCLVASVSGAVVTLNTSAGINDVMTTTDPPVVQLTTTVYAVSYYNAAATTMNVVCFTIASTTVTAGTPVVAETTALTNQTSTVSSANRFYPNFYKMDSTHALLRYIDGSNLARFTVITNTGTTVLTVGTLYYGLGFGATTSGMLTQSAAYFTLLQPAAQKSAYTVTITGTVLAMSGTSPAFGTNNNSTGRAALSGGYGVLFETNIGVHILKASSTGAPRYLGLLTLPNHSNGGTNRIITDLGGNKASINGQTRQTTSTGTQYMRHFIIEIASLGSTTAC